MGLGDFRSGRDPRDEPGTSPSGGGGFRNDDRQTFTAPQLDFDLAGVPGFDAEGNFDIAATPDERGLFQKFKDALSRNKGKLIGGVAGVAAGALTGNPLIGAAVSKGTQALIDRGIDRESAESIVEGISTGQITPEQGERLAMSAPGFREGPVGQGAITGQLGEVRNAAVAAGVPGLSGIPGTLSESAQQNIALQEGQLAEIERLTAPFRAAATDTALPALTALARGGDVDFQPSALFGRQLEKGRTGILRGQAAGGAGVKSSRTFEKLSDLVSGLAAEDVGRFEQGQTNLLNVGRGAESTLGQAGSALTGNVGSILTQLGGNLNIQGQQRAQDEQARAATLASGVQGLGNLALEFF